jgi:hypothetical protein
MPYQFLDKLLKKAAQSSSTQLILLELLNPTPQLAKQQSSSGHSFSQ